MSGLGTAASAVKKQMTPVPIPLQRLTSQHDNTPCFEFLDNVLYKLNPECSLGPYHVRGTILVLTNFQTGRSPSQFKADMVNKQSKAEHELCTKGGVHNNK